MLLCSSQLLLVARIRLRNRQQSNKYVGYWVCSAENKAFFSSRPTLPHNLLTGRFHARSCPDSDICSSRRLNNHLQMPQTLLYASEAGA